MRDTPHSRLFCDSIDDFSVRKKTLIELYCQAIKYKISFVGSLQKSRIINFRTAKKLHIVQVNLHFKTHEFSPAIENRPLKVSSPHKGPKTQLLTNKKANISRYNSKTLLGVKVYLIRR